MGSEEGGITSISFDPQEESNEFRCDVCNRYLSITPVLYNEKVGKLCGRCVDDGVLKKFSGYTFHSQKVYENIVKYINFPCSYQSNGCKEELKGNLVRQHEEICPFRENKCIFGTEELKFEEKPCKWSGNIKELILHLKNIHGNKFQMTSPSFYLGPKWNDKILLTEFMDAVFLCLVYVDHDSSVLYVHVLMDTSSMKCDDFIYNLEVRDTQSEKSINFPCIEVKSLCNRGLNPVFLKSGYDVDITAITTMLKSSHCLFFFEIKTKSNISSEGNSKDTLNNNLILDARCRNCSEILVPPIFVCDDNQNICKDCYNSEECCCDGATHDQNETLESLSRISLYVCKNTRSGCSETFDFQCLKFHEENCKYTAKPCVMGCEWSGNDFEALEHIQHEHPILILNEEKFFSMTESAVCTFCTLFEGNIFVLRIEFDPEESLWVSVRYIAMETATFQFKFTISSGGFKLECVGFCYPRLYGTVKQKALKYPVDFLNQFLVERTSALFKVDIFRYKNNKE